MEHSPAARMILSASSRRPAFIIAAAIPREPSGHAISIEFPDASGPPYGTGEVFLPRLSWS
jgi:hypothetical protein